MQRLIYPLITISISQRYHDKHKAWDLNGEDTGIDYFYAPCRLKVLAMFPYETTGFYNTVIFGSCDENGNPAEVMFEDGSLHIVSISCTHMNSLNKFGLVVGKIYQSGERCYCEGNTGLGSTGNHVHMAVAEGHQTKIVKYDDGKWYMPNVINPANVFCQLKDWNVTRNPNGYAFKVVESREVEDVAETMQPSLGGPMSFADALEYLELGHRMTRKGWKGRGLVLRRGYPDGIAANIDTAEAWNLNIGTEVCVDPYFQIQNSDGSLSVWEPTTRDVLSEDWYFA